MFVRFTSAVKTSWQQEGLQLFHRWTLKKISRIKLYFITIFMDFAVLLKH